jgi:hypothetical protein
MRRLVVTGALAVGAGGLWAAPVTAGPTPDVQTFCRTIADASILFNDVPDEDASKKEQARFQKKVEELLTQGELNAPPELAAQVTSTAEAIRGFFEAGEDPSEDPAFMQAAAEIDEYVFANCGYQTVDLSGLEYEFQGIPNTLEPGITIFRLANDGAEVHELAIGKIKGDDSAREIGESSPEDAEEKVRFASHAIALQGQTGFAYVDLKAGRYAALCFIPVGTTDPSALEEEEEEEEHEGAASHAEEGMFKGFKVRKG